MELLVSPNVTTIATNFKDLIKFLASSIPPLIPKVNNPLEPFLRYFCDLSYCEFPSNPG